MDDFLSSKRKDLVVIQQGEQFFFPIKIRDGETFITPHIVEEVCVKIGSSTKKYSEGGVTYSDATGAWLFEITQEESMDWSGNVPWQVAYKKGQTVRRSPVYTAVVNTSIIKELL